jgi:hypothetical protein
VTLQRGDTLPPGRYWQDFFGPKVDVATAWLLAQSQAGRARVDATEGSGDAGTWMLFTVSKPMPWPELELGAPTIAGPEVKSRADTAQRPPPEPGIIDQLKPSDIPWLAMAVGAAATLALLVLVLKLLDKGKD